jgi:hypothetical protein
MVARHAVPSGTEVMHAVSGGQMIGVPTHAPAMSQRSPPVVRFPSSQVAVV